MDFHKNVYDGILISIYLIIFIIGVFIGTRIPLESLRLEMIERDIVFCTVEQENSFVLPIAVPTNTTWDDLNTWNIWKTTD